MRQHSHSLACSVSHTDPGPSAALLPWAAGTNDNYRLLPQQVRQELGVERGLAATNGKMLEVLLRNPDVHTLAAGQVRACLTACTACCSTGRCHAWGGERALRLPPCRQTSCCCRWPALQDEPTWEALLRFAVDQGLDAIIDCGALLAGATNR